MELPPPSARAVGEVELVRVFETAESAMAFLSGRQARVTHGVVRFEPCAPFELTAPQSGALHRVACGLTLHYSGKTPADEKSSIISTSLATSTWSGVKIIIRFSGINSLLV